MTELGQKIGSVVRCKWCSEMHPGDIDSQDDVTRRCVVAERRRYALLQAAATINAGWCGADGGEGASWTFVDAIVMAIDMLDELERREHENG